MLEHTQDVLRKGGLHCFFYPLIAEDNADRTDFPYQTHVDFGVSNRALTHKQMYHLRVPFLRTNASFEIIAREDNPSTDHAVWSRGPQRLTGARINHLVLWTWKERRKPAVEYHLWSTALLLRSWLLFLALTFPKENEIFLHGWCLSWSSGLLFFIFFSISEFSELRTDFCFWPPPFIMRSRQRLEMEANSGTQFPFSPAHPCQWFTPGTRRTDKTPKRNFTSSHGQSIHFFPNPKTSLHTRWPFLKFTSRPFIYF